VTRTTTTRLIAEQLSNLNSIKTKKPHFETKVGPGNKSLFFLFVFEEINALKKQLQLKPEKTASSKKSTKEG
jgi:hypothetical protein